MKKVLILKAMVVGLGYTLLPALQAQPDSFTYQGILSLNGQSTEGFYDIRFNLHDTETLGQPLAVQTNLMTEVRAGRFTVSLSFGPDLFPGDSHRWLELAVRTNGVAEFEPLTPRQFLESAPYALTASRAMNVPMGVITNPQFLGTTSPNQPLDFYVNSLRGMRLSYSSNSTQGATINVIGGQPANQVGQDSMGAVIAGGGSGMFPNVIGSNTTYNAIGGGVGNIVATDADMNAIPGGSGNTLSSDVNYSIIGGGFLNGMRSNATYSVISGGSYNQIAAKARHASIGGGEGNRAGIESNYGSIGGGEANDIADNVDYATVSGGFRNLASDHRATVGGGVDNTASGTDATIAGGRQNQATRAGATVGGGSANLADDNNATVAGGSNNQALSSTSFIGGGNNNRTEANLAAIGGGQNNVASGSSSFLGGGLNNLTKSSYTVVGGGQANESSSSHAAITGGQRNRAIGNFSAIGGGRDNIANRDYGVVSGGQTNRAEGSFSTVGGGGQNAAIGTTSTVSGGGDNTASGQYSTVGGGFNNVADGLYSVVPGGLNNEANQNVSWAAGYRAKANHAGTFVWADSQEADFSSTAENQFLIRAAGGIGLGGANTSLGFVEVQQPSDDVDHGLSVVNSSRARSVRLWVDGGDRGHLDSGPEGGATLVLNQAGGSVGIGVDNPSTALEVNGTVTATAFNPSSDRNLKENFQAVNAEEVLERVVSLPLTRWNFKKQPETAHMGPMAQDFHHHFGLGTDDRHIATVDADGVALAAIQGLNAKLKRENDALRQDLAELQALVESLMRQSMRR